MSGPDDRHVVVHFARGTCLCTHCRAEVFLPDMPVPASSFVTYTGRFTAMHAVCPSPAPGAPHLHVPTDPDGAHLNRDGTGLWWHWAPAPAPARAHLVTPVRRDDALDALRALIATEINAPESDQGARQRANAARRALAAEGEDA